MKLPLREVDAIVPLAFLALMLGTVASAERRRRLRAKSWADWLIDGAGLSVQGSLVPLLQMLVLVALLERTIPKARGALELGLIGGFLINFVLVDYLYYWNHRLLHSDALWRIHYVHHTVTDFDILGTSRNTLWTSFFILYIWLNSLFSFLLADPTGYLIGAGLTAGLDLWRHSELGPRPGSRPARLLGTVLILPKDHAVHHGLNSEPGNYGANLPFWDRLHGTWRPGKLDSQPRGLALDIGLIRRLFWPFNAPKEAA